MTASQLDPSAGFYLKGVGVDDQTFLASVQFRQLRAVTRDPMTLQATGTRRDDDPDLADEREVHDLVQRAVTGSKKSNVARYAAYIVGILHDKVGVLPPVHLWTKSALDTFTVDSGTFVLVPLGDTMLAIDGETQLTAHWRIARGDVDGADKATRDAHARMPLSVVIHHGVGTTVARQYFHDLNILAVRPNTGVGLAMDTNDPIMQVVGDVEATAALENKVDRQGRQLGKRSDKIVTLSALRQMIINIAHGMSGVQYGSRPAPVDEDRLAQLAELAPLVVAGYFQAFDRQIAEREDFIAGTAPVLAAVGAMAEPLMGRDRTAQQRGLDDLFTGLGRVDWSRGETWRGIAGDYTSRGVFSVKGTKEVAYAVFNALTDERSPAYDRIRRTATTPEGAESNLISAAATQTTR